jgi:hypothetical protein
VQAKLFERRREMVKNHNMGLPLADSVQHLASKYGNATTTLYADWRKRRTWLKVLLAIDDPETFWLDLIATHRDIKRLATLEYLKGGDNGNVKIGALRLIRDLNLDMADLLECYDYERRLQNLENAS